MPIDTATTCPVPTERLCPQWPPASSSAAGGLRVRKVCAHHVLTSPSIKCRLIDIDMCERQRSSWLMNSFLCGATDRKCLFLQLVGCVQERRLLFIPVGRLLLLSYPLVKFVVSHLIPQLPVRQQLRLHHRVGSLAPPLGCNVLLQFTVSNKQIHCSSSTAFSSETKTTFKVPALLAGNCPSESTSCWTNRKWARCSQ